MGFPTQFTQLLSENWICVIGEGLEMTNTEFFKNYWRYYLMLEKKFLETIEYVEIHTDNYGSFSNEFTMLLQAIGAELDNVFKVYCGFNLKDRKNISDYAKIILSDYPDIIRQIVKVKDRDIILIPFKNWNVERAAQSLQWWKAFDDIKHNRCENIKEGNLGNVLNILAALYLVPCNI